MAKDPLHSSHKYALLFLVREGAVDCFSDTGEKVWYKYANEQSLCADTENFVSFFSELAIKEAALYQFIL